MMITNYSKLNKIINSNITKGIFLVCGNEKYLIDKSIKLFQNMICNFYELNYITLDGHNLNKEIIEDACETLPFMAPFKIVYIKDMNILKKASSQGEEKAEKKYKENAEIENYLLELCEKQPEGLILLISIDGEENEKNKLIINIKNNHYLVKYKYLKGEDLNKAVLNMFLKNNKSINKADLTYLLSKTGNSLYEIQLEVDKLCAYKMDEPNITKHDIDLIVHKGIEDNIFKMVDYISKKDAQNAVSILDNLLYQNENHLRILGMIIRQFRMLLLTKLCLDKRLNFNDIKKYLNIKSDFQVQNFISLVKNFDIKSIANSLRCCLNTDMDIKTGNYNPNMALEMLVIELCK